MLGVSKKHTSGFSQVMEVYSEQCLLVCVVTQLCSPSNVCVGGVDTCCVHTQCSSSPQLAQLFCLHSGMVVLL